MKAIKCQLKMRPDMPGQTIQGLLEYVYNQPIIAGHPKQVRLISVQCRHLYSTSTVLVLCHIIDLGGGLQH